MLSLGLLDHAAARRAEAAKAQSVQAEGGYTITGEGDPEIDALVLQRYQAKKEKNWAQADAIRDQLKSMGVEIKDTPNGVEWKRI